MLELKIQKKKKKGASLQPRTSPTSICDFDCAIQMRPLFAKELPRISQTLLPSKISSHQRFLMTSATPGRCSCGATAGTAGSASRFPAAEASNSSQSRTGGGAETLWGKCLDFRGAFGFKSDALELSSRNINGEAFGGKGFSDFSASGGWSLIVDLIFSTKRSDFPDFGWRSGRSDPGLELLGSICSPGVTCFTVGSFSGVSGLSFRNRTFAEGGSFRAGNLLDFGVPRKSGPMSSSRSFFGTVSNVSKLSSLSSLSISISIFFSETLRVFLHLQSLEVIVVIVVIVLSSSESQTIATFLLHNFSQPMALDSPPGHAQLVWLGLSGHVTFAKLTSSC